MARIRTVKPELFGHEELFDAERETGLPLRLAFIGLFTCSDREGRFKWRPRTLKKDVMPHDEIDFSRVLDALATRGFIRKYAFGTEEYGVIPTWNKHQVINNRESQSEIPDPEESAYISMTSTREARVDDATGTRLVHAQGEGKGKEGKGREEEQTHVASAPDGCAVVVGPERRKQARTETAHGKEAVEEVFQYWQLKMGHPQAKLDAKRRKAISGRLQDGYTVGDLCSAVDGCKLSPHHMGQNANRTVYDDIELICRDGTKVDGFIRRIRSSGAAMSPGLQQQVDILNEWMNEDN